MRNLLVGMLSIALFACGSGQKKRTVAADRSSSGPADRAGALPGSNKGDVTLTTSTNDDLSWLGPVYFEFDSSTLQQETRTTLSRLHDWLAAHPRTKLTIEGHCDEQGTTEYNIGLGQRRAQTMVDYLVRLGTQPSGLTAVSYGAERPAVDGHDDVAWAKNRRGEFRVAP